MRAMFDARPLRDMTAKDCYEINRYAFISAKDLAAAHDVTIEQLQKIVKKLKTLKNARVRNKVIGGSVIMISIKAGSFKGRKNVLAEWKALVKSAFGIIGVEMPEHMVAPNILISVPGQGEQDLHWDSYKPDEIKRISIFFYLNPGRSTSVPIYPFGMIRHTGELQGQDDARRIAMQNDSMFLQPGCFHNIAVQPGDMMIMHHGVPHHGLQNREDKDRYVFFDTASPTNGNHQTDWQYFEHQYCSDAFGEDSLSRYKALLNSLDKTPSHAIASRDKELNQHIVKHSKAIIEMAEPRKET